MHINAELAKALRSFSKDGSFTDPFYEKESQRKGLIAPSPRLRSGLVLTKKGEEFLRKWG